VTIHKDCPLSSLRIALLADLHLGGAVGLHHMQKVCQAVNEMQPDLVILAGDIFDNDFSVIDYPEQICNALRNVHTRYGTYACWGNHDIEELILAGFTFNSKKTKASCSPEMAQFLKDADIRLLADETVLIDDAFYLCGRLDASCEAKSGTSRLTPDQLTAALDHARPILVIDHQPSELEALSKAGVDLDLSGHTHDGQIFPLNLTTSLLWANSRGYKKFRHMSSIVTAGAGTWGPSQRIATHSEIVEVHVQFQ
jgi:predicted MPP superfamily phosphohydrolase